MGSRVLGTQHCLQAGWLNGLETTLLGSHLRLQDVRTWARWGVYSWRLGMPALVTPPPSFSRLGEGAGLPS